MFTVGYYNMSVSCFVKRLNMHKGLCDYVQEYAMKNYLYYLTMLLSEDMSGHVYSRFLAH